jgi:hypothetical protein
MALVLNLGALPVAQLRALQFAGEIVAGCADEWRQQARRVFDDFVEDPPEQDACRHYPADDVRDPAAGTQYFYHCHRGAQEHGHFHVFLRRAGMPGGVRARRWPRSVAWPRGRSSIAHLVAISMTADGSPQALFSTNRWVTEETWYRARDVVRMLDCFHGNPAAPSALADRWLVAMLVLFRPQIEFLLHHRDQVVEHWRRGRFPTDVLEDRELEITGMLAIDVQGQRRAVAAALSRRLDGRRERTEANAGAGPSSVLAAECPPGVVGPRSATCARRPPSSDPACGE